MDKLEGAGSKIMNIGLTTIDVRERNSVQYSEGLTDAILGAALHLFTTGCILLAQVQSACL